MKFTLVDYQEDASRSVVRRLRSARSGYAEHGDLTAIGLTAPTGAGKTVIATAVLEALMFGGLDVDADPHLTMLWLNDDPSLNVQTMGKMLLASDQLEPHHLRLLTEAPGPTLESGFIYFAHIQSLGRGATSSPSAVGGIENDHRTHGVWDILAATVAARGADLLVVIDEAHRGTGVGRTSAENTARRTIAATVVHGGTSPVGTVQPPAPVVFGISATPERFNAAMQSQSGPTTRTLVPVPVDMAKVRASGLLKDVIDVRRPGEKQDAEHTLIQLAVANLKSSDAAWRSHHERTDDPLVEPIMVLQVPPGVSGSELGRILASLEEGWSELKDLAVAHAFDTHADVAVKAGAEVRTIRYIPPHAISDDDRVRVVLAKNALTTGWDCPRAEVMLSLRASNDPTTIAQLIGRMVRPPWRSGSRTGQTS